MNMLGGSYQPKGSDKPKGPPPTGGSGVPQGAAVPRGNHTPQLADARRSPFVNALIDAGIVPDNCRRVVIDCNTGHAIKIHYEVYGDERLNEPSVLDAVFELGLKIKAEAEK